MLEAPQATQHDVEIIEPIETKPIDRCHGRSYRDGYSEDGINRLDLFHQESTASADGAFAAALERAIEAGLERDIAVTIEEHGTERPMTVVVPRVPLPEQVPAVPQIAQNLARRIAYVQRHEAITDRRARDLEARVAMERPAPDPGAFTLFDLHDKACHFSTGEGPYLFCGDVTQRKSAYCPTHHAVCYGPFWGTESATNQG